MKQWIQKAGIRSIKTMAQTAVGLIAGNAVVVSDVDWVMVASASIVAGVLSLLMSVDGLPELTNDGVTVEEEASQTEESEE